MRFTRTSLLALLLLATPAWAFNVGYQTQPLQGTSNSFTSGDPFTNGPYIMPKNGVLQSCSIYVSTITDTMVLGLYSGTSLTVPATLLGTTAAFTPVKGWTTVQTTTHPVVKVGTILFLGALGVTGGTANTTAADPNPPNVLYWNSVAAQSVLPAAFGTPASQVNPFQWGGYCTFMGDDKLPGRTR